MWQFPLPRRRSWSWHAEEPTMHYRNRRPRSSRDDEHLRWNTETWRLKRRQSDWGQRWRSQVEPKVPIGRRLTEGAWWSRKAEGFRWSRRREEPERHWKEPVDNASTGCGGVLVSEAGGRARGSSGLCGAGELKHQSGSTHLRAGDEEGWRVPEEVGLRKW